jgi:NADH:ubiquinone oxidoreductase subunit 2 (subunit N)
MVWAGLFVTSLFNFLHILLVLDAMSLMIVSIVALSSSLGRTRAISCALHYYVLSALTSFLSYVGCLFLYLTFYSLDVNVITFLEGSGEDLGGLFSNRAFFLGALLILIKVVFLLGLFPFQQYLIEISSAVNYGFLFYFLVVSKLPIFVVFLNLMKIL